MGRQILKVEIETMKNRNPITYLWLGTLLLAALTSTAFAAAGDRDARQRNIRAELIADTDDVQLKEARSADSRRPLEVEYLGWPTTPKGPWWLIWKIGSLSKVSRFNDRADARGVRTDSMTNAEFEASARVDKKYRLRLNLKDRASIREAKDSRAEVRFNRADEEKPSYTKVIRKDNGSAMKATRALRDREFVRFGERELDRVTMRFEKNSRERNSRRDFANRLLTNRINRDSRRSEAFA